MDETFQTSVIILNRLPFGEDDSKIIAYSPTKGKIELIARGTKKIKSKLAGHLEPITLTDLMVVPGKQYDYVGNAVSRISYANIKSDLDKLTVAGQVIGIFNKIIKSGQSERDIYELLNDFLTLLNLGNVNKADYNLLASFFIIKLLSELGYKPELFYCVICKMKIKPSNNKFDLAKGGVICRDCSIKAAGQYRLTIPDDGIKLLRLASRCDLLKLANIKINEKLKKDVMSIISFFLRYHFDMKHCL